MSYPEGHYLARAAEAKETYPAALVDRLGEGKVRGDEPADALVAVFATLPAGTGWAMVDAAMDRVAAGLDPHVDGAPPEIAALLRPIAALPTDLGADVLRAGALAYWRPGSQVIALALTCGSLAFGYQSANLVRPLAMTGRLERMAPRRLGETARWVAVATAPGAMLPGADGWRATVRVRLVHALVRRHLRASPAWDEELWGMPISATDGLATAVGGFLTVPLRAMRDLGVRHSAAELEAMTRLWSWIGAVMGVPGDLLPRTLAEAREMIDAALAMDVGPTDDSPRLMHALLHHGVAIARLVPGRPGAPIRAATAEVLGGFARRWMDRDMADHLGVGGRLVSPLVPLMRPLSFARETVRATGVLGSEEAMVAREIALVHRVLSVTRAPATALAPEAAEGEPVLAAVA
jgi:hypothetical protein